MWVGIFPSQSIFTRYNKTREIFYLPGLCVCMYKNVIENSCAFVCWMSRIFPSNYYFAQLFFSSFIGLAFSLCTGTNPWVERLSAFSSHFKERMRDGNSLWTITLSCSDSWFVYALWNEWGLKNEFRIDSMDHWLRLLPIVFSRKHEMVANSIFHILISYSSD